MRMVRHTLWDGQDGTRVSERAKLEPGSIRPRLAQRNRRHVETSSAIVVLSGLTFRARLLEQPQPRRRQQSPRLSSTRQRKVPFDPHEGGVWRDDRRLIAGDITEADASHGSDGNPLQLASQHRSRPSAQRSRRPPPSAGVELGW
jgi:hypothetical protein